MWKFAFLLAFICSSDVANLYPQNPYHYGNEESEEYGVARRTRDIQFGACVIVINRLCPDRDVTFHLYTQDNPTVPERVRIGSDPFSTNLRSTSFNPSLPSKIIVHGYNSGMYLSALVEVKKEYLRNQNMNVFAVDWSNLAQSPCYPGAVWNSRFVGKCSAQLVERIRELGATDIHVIGFSLGAHVTGFMADNLLPYKLPRITGLDPALPGFVTLDKDSKLDAGDAKFVDIIHTNAFMQGKVEQSGDVDFYVNGGAIQPGCWAEERFFACNHHRAPIYFAESINTQKGFYGWPCPSYASYVLGRCPPKEPQIIMGEHVSKAAEGIYLVITDSVAPYAVGKFTGSLIEIFLTKMKKTRLFDLQRFKKDVETYVGLDDALDEAVYDFGNLKQRRKKPQEDHYRHKSYAQGEVEDPFDYGFNYTEIFNSVGF